MLILQKVFSGHESVKRIFIKFVPWVLLIIFHSLFTPYLVRNIEYGLIIILSSVYLFSIHESRATLSSVFKDFSIFWMSSCFLLVFLKFTNVIYLIGILPIFAMKNDSIRATTRSLMWIIAIFLMLLISEIDVGKGLFIREYFLELLFLIIFLFFTNTKTSNIKALQYYALTLGCFNSLITHYSYIPFTFKYIFVGVQLFTLLRFYIEGKVQNIILSTLCFAVLIIPEVSAVSELQLFLIVYIGYIVLCDIIKNKLISRYINVFLSTFVVYLILFQVSSSPMLTKISGLILVVNIIVSAYQKLIISDTFVQS